MIVNEIGARIARVLLSIVNHFVFIICKPFVCAKINMLVFRGTEMKHLQVCDLSFDEPTMDRHGLSVD
ncbi:hypothetical protein D3C87_1958330 [compost metagenome]